MPKMSHTAAAEAAIAKARGDLADVTAKRDEIDNLLHGDPVVAQKTLNRSSGRIYSADSALKHLGEKLADQEREIKRLQRILDALEVELPLAQARDKLAREKAADAAALIVAVETALTSKGEALASELRALLRQATDALNAMDDANAALPDSEQMVPSTMLARLRTVPERIVSTRTTEVWLSEDGDVVSEDRLRFPVGTDLTEMRKRRAAGIRDRFTRAFLTDVIETTFVPEHRYDWLNPNEPETRVRYEKIERPKRYELTEETIGSVSRHPMHPLA